MTNPQPFVQTRLSQNKFDILCIPANHPDVFHYSENDNIGLGKGKIMTVLALDIKHHLLNHGAPALANTQCIAVSVASSWTGETIADLLQKIIIITGTPVAYLKDGGTDLGKAVRLLNERGQPGLSIDDISHFIANLLKHEYQKHPQFETFIQEMLTLQWVAVNQE